MNVLPLASVENFSTVLNTLLNLNQERVGPLNLLCVGTAFVWIKVVRFPILQHVLCCEMEYLRVSCCLISTDSPPSPTIPHTQSHKHLCLCENVQLHHFILLSSFSSAYIVIHEAQLELGEGCIIAASFSGARSSALASSHHSRVMVPVSTLFP